MGLLYSTISNLPQNEGCREAGIDCHDCKDDGENLAGRLRLSRLVLKAAVDAQSGSHHLIVPVNVMRTAADQGHRCPCRSIRLRRGHFLIAYSRKPRAMTLLRWRSRLLPFPTMAYCS